jgi:DNA-directed RNA polymerase subunit alpha
MSIALKQFVMPKALELDEKSATETYGRFIAEPFERGYGVTVGNSLRRVLLSSLEGAAVTSVRIEGVAHEFSTIPGVQEDMSEIVLNLKSLIVRSHSKAPKTVIIEADKKGEITGADLKTDDSIEIVNPDLKICTLTKKLNFKAELEIGRGRGYVPADQNKKEGQTIGTIAIDSIFSPVRKVAFKVEDTRVGQITDYDKLIIEIWTNGSVTPKDAILYAANIMQQQLNVFVDFGRLPEEEGDLGAGSDPQEAELYKKLAQPVSELELSVRSANCLNEARIKTIGDLVARTEAEMLKYRNFGKKSLTEISQILKDMGLHFGMQIDPKKLKSAVGSDAAEA